MLKKMLLKKHTKQKKKPHSKTNNPKSKHFLLSQKKKINMNESAIIEIKQKPASRRTTSEKQIQYDN